MDYKNLKRVVELISEHDLNEFEMEYEGVRLSVKRGVNSSEAIPITLPPSYTMAGPPAAGPPASAPAQDLGSPAPASVDDGLIEIISPMVGTFYLASSPDVADYVSIGDRVDTNSTVCIIEAMKVMNELKADTSGIIREILVENATPVEYGQPLFRVEPA